MNTGFAESLKHGESRSRSAWHRALAESGRMYRAIATRYRFGAGGFAPDDARAAFWHGLAARCGDARAQEQLGLFYLHGSGLMRDPVLAARWLLLSAEQGNPDAQAMVANAYRFGWGGLPADRAEADRWERLTQGLRASRTHPLPAVARLDRAP